MAGKVKAVLYKDMPIEEVSDAIGFYPYVIVELEKEFRKLLEENNQKSFIMILN